MSNITTDFITTTKKIVAEVRGVLTALHLIREDVKIIREQVVSESNKQTPDQQKNESEAKEPEEIGVLGKPLDKAQSRSKKGQSKQEIKSGFGSFVKRLKRNIKRPKFIIELLALAGLVVYTCETRRTNNLTQESLRRSALQFRDEQRPYLSAEPRGGFVADAEKKTFLLCNKEGEATLCVVVVDLSNIGKSPALETRATPTRYIFGTPNIVHRTVQQYVPDYSKITPGIVTMNTGLTPNSEMQKFSEEESQKLRDGTWEFYVVGGVIYKDRFIPPIDPPYETTYCYHVRFQGMPFGNCNFTPPAFGSSMK